MTTLELKQKNPNGHTFVITILDEYLDECGFDEKTNSIGLKRKYHLEMYNNKEKENV